MKARTRPFVVGVVTVSHLKKINFFTLPSNWKLSFMTCIYVNAAVKTGHVQETILSD